MFGASQTPAVDRPLEISASGSTELVDVTQSAAARRRERLDRTIQKAVKYVRDRATTVAMHLLRRVLMGLGDLKA